MILFMVLTSYRVIQGYYLGRPCTVSGSFRLGVILPEQLARLGHDDDTIESEAGDRPHPNDPAHGPNSA
jgi:hypothetical protein